VSGKDAAPRLRVLKLADRAAASELAQRSFEGNRFYEDALGLRAADFPVYWDALMQLALGSDRARVYGLECSGRLQGMILAALDGFPSKSGGIEFLVRMLARLGPRRLIRYLRFVRAYDRALDTMGHPRGDEARCFWLMVSPDARVRLGPWLVREVVAALAREGKPVATGLINAGDHRIRNFYRRLGFTFGEPFPFFGETAATIQIRILPEGRARPLTTRCHQRLDEIDPSRWDAVGKDPLSTHAVLTSIDRAGLPGVRLRALTVEEETGRWIAAAPLATIEVDGAKLTRGLFRATVRTVRKVHPGFLRTSVLLCGTPLSVGNSPARIVDGVPTSRVYAELAGALQRIADADGIAWRSFKEIPLGDVAAVGETLASRGWTIAPSEPNLALALPWRSFSAYLQSLRSHYRYKVRLAERKRIQERLEVDAVPLSEGYDTAAHALYEAVFARARVQLEHLTPEFFQELGRSHPRSAWLLRFRRDGTLVGWVAMFLADGVAYDLFHGMDYGACASSSLYFNQLAEVIRFAIQRGAHALVLGQSSETAKARFGGRAVPLWIAVRHRSAVWSLLLRSGRRWLFPAPRVPTREVFAPAALRAEDSAR